ncbi:MAG: DUF2339 domain-containing protein [Spirochaetia bacterium]|nr:DUF2339 domain-containing protein [Spirochaetia bacterium]
MDELSRLETRIRELEGRLIRNESEMQSLRSEFIALERQHRELAARIGAKANRPATLNEPVQPEVPVPSSYSTPSAKATADSRPLSYTQPAARSQPATYNQPSTQTQTQTRQPAQPSWFTQSFDQLMVRLKAKIGNIPVEEFLGMNLLNKIGILILVLGVSFFLKIAYGWIGPGLKVAMLTAVSVALLVIGDSFYRRKNFIVFGLGLISGGMVILFFTAYASYNYEATRIIPMDLRYAGYAIQVALTILMIIGTLRYNREAITSFAYFLSFLCVSINETGEFNHFSLAVVGLLAASLILIITIKRWKYLTGFGILATYANFAVYSLSLPRGSDGYVVSDDSNYFLFSIIYLSFYWTVFHVSVFSMKVETKPEAITGLTVNIANASAFLGLVTYVRPEPTLWGGFVIFGSLGLVYVVSAIIARKLHRDHIWKSSIVIGSAFIALGLGLRFSGASLVLVWLIQATIMIVCGYLFQETYLRNLGYAAFLLKIGALFALPSADAIHRGQEIASFEFQVNRSSVYIGIILSALAIQIVSRPYKKNSIDVVAWHVLGGMLVLATLLLSIYTIAFPHQALLIVPVGLALIVFSRLTAIRAHIAYGSVLFGLASMFSAVLLVSGPGYKSNLDPLFVICTLLLAPLVGFLFLVSPFQPADLRADVRSPASPWYLATTSILFVSLIALISLVVNYGPQQAISLLFIIPALLLLYSDRRTEHGKLQFLMLCGFTFLLSIYQFQKAFASGSDGDRITFLSNAIVLWLLTAGSYYLTDKYRGSLLLSVCLNVVSSIEALLILQQITDPALYPASVAAYSLAILLLAMYFRITVIVAVLLNALALLMGPLRLTGAFADVTPWMSRIDLGLLCLLFTLSAILSWRIKTDSYFNYFYYSAMTGILATVYILMPLEFHPMAFSALAVVSMFLISKFLREGIEASWKILTAVSMISFVYMLVKMNMRPEVQPEWLKAVLGISPLALISFSTRLYSDNLKTVSDPRSDMFRKFVIFAVFLLLVALTMTLIDARYWSVAWAVEATALVLLGLVWRMTALRFTGMALIAIMLLKVAFWDLKNLEDTVRVAVLIAIGLLLVGASFLYARFKDRLMGVENEKA